MKQKINVQITDKIKKKWLHLWCHRYSKCDPDSSDLNPVPNPNPVPDSNGQWRNDPETKIDIVQLVR